MAYWDCALLNSPGCPQTQDSASSPSRELRFQMCDNLTTVSSLVLNLPTTELCYPPNSESRALTYKMINITDHYATVKANSLKFFLLLSGMHSLTWES